MLPSVLADTQQGKAIQPPPNTHSREIGAEMVFTMDAHQVSPEEQAAVADVKQAAKMLPGFSGMMVDFYDEYEWDEANERFRYDRPAVNQYIRVKLSLGDEWHAFQFDRSKDIRVEGLRFVEMVAARRA